MIRNDNDSHYRLKRIDRRLMHAILIGMTQHPHRLKTVASVCRTLIRWYQPRDWWPGRDDPFEVVVGAILTQRTTWAQAAKAIEALRGSGLLTPKAFLTADRTCLERLLRPAGFYREKTKKLTAFCRLLRDDYACAWDRLADQPKQELRKTLLSVYGIGEETADAILVYAAGRPSFVIDAYTRRLFARLDLIHGAESYGELQTLFEDALETDVALYADAHAAIVMHGASTCRPRPRCDTCPVRDDCSFADTMENA